MATEHNVIVDAERHEPKGADAATIGQVFVSNGANSGAFTSRFTVLNAVIDDISDAAASSFWVVCPVAGDVTKIYSVIDTVITTGDAVLTFEISGTLITNSTITIANAGSAVGDVDSSTPTALNAVTAGQAIEIITDGGSTVACKAEITIVITGTTNG